MNTREIRQKYAAHNALFPIQKTKIHKSNDFKILELGGPCFFCLIFVFAFFVRFL